MVVVTAQYQRTGQPCPHHSNRKKEKRNTSNKMNLVVKPMGGTEAITEGMESKAAALSTGSGV